MDTYDKGKTCIVDIWRLDFDNTMTDTEALALLNPAECKRANAFYFERDRHNFVLSHGYLRVVLAQYCTTHPSNITFRIGPFGKPFLADQDNLLRFNLSHTKTSCIVAVTHGCEIGVDVENLRKIGNRDVMWRGVLTLEEQNAIDAIAPEYRDRLFLNFWTCKEAVLKASGYGLNIQPDRINLTVDMMDSSIISLANEENIVSKYHIFNLSTRDLMAAVAVRNPNGAIQVIERKNKCLRNQSGVEISFL